MSDSSSQDAAAHSAEKKCIRVHRKGSLRNQSRFDPLFGGAFAKLGHGSRGRRLKLFQKHWQHIESKFHNMFDSINNRVFDDICAFVDASVTGDFPLVHLGVVPVAHINIGVSFGDNSFWLDPLAATLASKSTSFVVHVAGGLVQTTKDVFEIVMEGYGVIGSESTERVSSPSLPRSSSNTTQRSRMRSSRGFRPVGQGTSSGSDVEADSRRRPLRQRRHSADGSGTDSGSDSRYPLRLSRSTSASGSNELLPASPRQTEADIKFAKQYLTHASAIMLANDVHQWYTETVVNDGSSGDTASGSLCSPKTPLVIILTESEIIPDIIMQRFVEMLRVQLAGVPFVLVMVSAHIYHQLTNASQCLGANSLWVQFLFVGPFNSAAGSIPSDCCTITSRELLQLDEPTQSHLGPDPDTCY